MEDRNYLIESSEKALIEHRQKVNFYHPTWLEKLVSNYAKTSQGSLSSLATIVRASGIDLSHWQDYFIPADNPPNPNDFAFLKFSEGYATAETSAMWKAIETLPVNGGYHYYRNQTSVIAQYDAFMKSADGKSVDVAILDFEGYGNTVGPQMYADAFNWLDKIRETGQFTKTMLYTNKNYYQIMNGWGNRHKLTPSGEPLDFWYAHYWNPVADTQTAEPYLPKQCPTWTFWQGEICQLYGSKKDGRDFKVKSSQLDLNVFNGTLDELLIWAGKTPPVIDPPGDELKAQIMLELQQAENHLKAAKGFTSQLP